jgi:tRNA (cmo5U34)-methyltransferase
MNTTDHIWRTDDVVQRYLEGVRGGIPLAAEQVRILLRLVAAAVPNVGSFLDVGCGDGVLGRALLDRWPSAHAVFLDFSEPMLLAAREKLGTPCHHRFITQDYGQPDWTAVVADLCPFDVVVSGFSIHHQPDDRKRAIYRDVLGLLRPGGIFLNLEHVASASTWGSERFDEYFVDSLCDFHDRTGSGKSREQVAQEYYHRADKAANILAPVEDQCRWLREIGFADVDCYFKTFELALFGGIKRPATPHLRPGERP